MLFNVNSPISAKKKDEKTQGGEKTRPDRIAHLSYLGS
jgi:hypothetical protein